MSKNKKKLFKVKFKQLLFLTESQINKEHTQY
jgi:hypothetical protein